ncbi:MAG: Gldg family protein [Chitinophagaceae bacterium]|nr:Gldg family protein [Chitinophagaceae bacterium]
MRTTYKIANTELQVLFYSPVAWLILIIFTFQSGFLFCESYDSMVQKQELGWQLYTATLSTFGGFAGLFTKVQSYLFLYIPLLTMGVMSRELGSGSIKLLYSSPLTTRQIILGKYLALVIFGLVLIAILAAFGVYAIFTINHVDIPLILSGLLGLFLLICAYAAIGLFMSSLTSYTVVAAMGTLAIFALLGYVKEVGQDIEFVRDITYWLAISGRCETFINGMITSEDVLYFLIVICLFVGLSIFKLQAGRQKRSPSVTFVRYAAIFAAAIMLGYFSAKPSLKGYVDVTQTKINTLTRSSQDVVSKLTDGLTITSYVNMLEPNYHIGLPQYYKADVDRFKNYIRFKPEIKMKTVYYYHQAENEQLDKQFPKLNAQQRMDTLRRIQNFKFDIHTYDEIKKEVDLEPEMFRFIRVLERENGTKTFLRVFDDNMRLPTEAEITAAFKRLVMKLPVVGFLSGHGERPSDGRQDHGYSMIAQDKTFRYALINQGFDFKNVTLDKEIPEDIRILVIAEVKTALSPEEMERLNRFIAKGGNLLIAGEPGRQAFMNPITEPLGVKFLPGTLVKPSEKFSTDLLVMDPTREAVDFSYYFKSMNKLGAVMTMPGAGALEFNAGKGFEATTLFRTDSTGSWNELETTNFKDDSARLNTSAGEVMQSLPTMLALKRKVNNREQKIIITGDADWLSNGELGMNRKNVNAGNFAVLNASFFWMSDGEVPIDMRRDPYPDTSLSVGKKGWAISSILLKWIFPASLILTGLFIWIRRRGR